MVQSLLHWISDMEPVEPTLRCIGTRVRRLTSAEVVRSARDVFVRGNDVAMTALAVPADEYDDDDTLELSTSFLESMHRLAALVGSAIVDHHRENLASLSAEEVEVRRFIDTYIQHAYRRPLTASDRQRSLELFAVTRRHESFARSLATLVQSALLSAHFLFRTELGEPVATRGVVHLTGHEIATALAYFVWGTTPGQELLRAADSGLLRDPKGLERYATAMLDDESGARRVMEARDSVHLLRMAFGRHASGELELDPATEDKIDSASDNRQAALAIITSPLFVLRETSIRAL
jgi:hypothetical protein